MPTNINGTTGVDKIQDGSVHDVDIDSVSASKLTGALPAIDGSALTSLTSGNLTGALPAISGANLTDLPSSSSQCVTTVYTGNTTYAVASAGLTGTYIAVLNTTITPTAVSSRVRVEFNVSFEIVQDTIFRLFREIGGTSTEVVRNANTNYWSGFAYPGYDVDNSTTPRTNHYVYIDSPNTTSAITYKLMIQSGGVGATTFFLNRAIANAGAANVENAVSQCILTEIP